MNILMAVQFERHCLKGQRSTMTFILMYNHLDILSAAVDSRLSQLEDVYL